MRLRFRRTSVTVGISLCLILVFTCGAAPLVSAQQSPSYGTNGNINERERALMDRERALRAQESEAVNRNRKNAALNSKADSHQTLTTKQIHEDFEKIQVINVQLKDAYSASSVLNYKQVAEGTAEIKKRAERLRENLALPKAKGDKSKIIVPLNPELPQALAGLSSAIKSFVSNPYFLNPNIIDAQHLTKTRNDLDEIIRLSDQLSKEARKINKLSSR